MERNVYEFIPALMNIKDFNLGSFTINFKAIDLWNSKNLKQLSFVNLLYHEFSNFIDQERVVQVLKDEMILEKGKFEEAADFLS